jgi:adenylosuccinate synthase
MSVTAVVGTNWGDEGKGRIVDLLARSADAIVRFQGGANAGHTIVNELGKFIFHLIPSGILYPDTLNILGPGVVVDPQALADELEELRGRVDQIGSFLVSDRAHVVLPLHKKIEAALDDQPDLLKYGSTKRGIAPTYQFKVAKVGLQMGELLRDEAHLRARLQTIVAFANVMFRGLGVDEDSSAPCEISTGESIPTALPRTRSRVTARWGRAWLLMKSPRFSGSARPTAPRWALGPSSPSSKGRLPSASARSGRNTVRRRDALDASDGLTPSLPVTARASREPPRSW